MEHVKDFKINTNTSIKELMDQFSQGGGFSAKMFSDGIKIFKSMQNDKECTKFFSFPACICATGVRGVIKDMVKNKMVDVIITTCGTIDHDLARLWGHYYQGRFDVDDRELHKKGINRLGNVFVPNDDYGIILEKKLLPIIEEICKEKKDWSTRDIIWKIGEKIAKEPNAEESIIYWAWKHQIPMFIPGPTDGSFGAQLWIYYQTHRDFRFDLMKDEQDMSDIIFNAKKSGALMLGGGISKHHTIWWNLYRNGLDYAVQISTAPEWDGSLSGAQVREAISWGKVREDARQVTIPGEVTILLPLLYASVLEK